MINSKARENFITRAKIITYLRRFLDNMGFLEVSAAIVRHCKGRPPCLLRKLHGRWKRP